MLWSMWSRSTKAPSETSAKATIKCGWIVKRGHCTASEHSSVTRQMAIIPAKLLYYCYSSRKKYMQEMLNKMSHIYFIVSSVIFAL